MSSVAAQHTAQMPIQISDMAHHSPARRRSQERTPRPQRLRRRLTLGEVMAEEGGMVRTVATTLHRRPSQHPGAPTPRPEYMDRNSQAHSNCHHHYLPAYTLKTTRKTLVPRPMVAITPHHLRQRPTRQHYRRRSDIRTALNLLRMVASTLLPLLLRTVASILPLDLAYQINSLPGKDKPLFNP